MHPRRIQLLIRFGYDGSRFHGLQPQGHLPTAGQALRTRVEAAAGQRARALCFAARTDAGVHAFANLATCWLVGPLDEARILADIARPQDDGLVLVRAEIVPSSVHARGAARGKRYRYVLEDERPEGDIDGRYAWQLVPRLDEERMAEGARHLVGTHDFSSFRARRCAMRSPIKSLTSVRVAGPFPLEGGGRRLFVELAGDAFLRKMVRILVGTLAEVGAGLREPDDVRRILEARDREAAGITAPARGLVLLQVGCAWPDDGSRLIPELASLASVDEEESVASEDA